MQGGLITSINFGLFSDDLSLQVLSIALSIALCVIQSLFLSLYIPILHTVCKMVIIKDKGCRVAFIKV